LLTYPASIPLSTATLTHLSDLLRSARQANGTRWRRLNPGRQALLVLAHLRNGDTYARLAAGFGVGIATVCRYIREALDLLASAAPSLDQVVYRASRLLYVILDGTLIPIDRIAADRPYYSGKHKRHGVNIQVLADRKGRLLWASPALPGAVHDVKAARTHGIPAMLIKFGVACYADNAYRGAGPTIAVPFRRGPRPLSKAQRQVNASHARNRGPGERAMAILKTWKLLTKLRCCPSRATAIVAAIRVLQAIDEQPK
jgi:DDE superfamily endonuclease/Helix-turn-helix of DDE superfamily endonuclease